MCEGDYVVQVRNSLPKSRKLRLRAEDFFAQTLNPEVLVCF